MPPPQMPRPCLPVAPTKARNPVVGDIGLETDDRWNRIEEVFYAAWDLDAEARPAFLQLSCGHNPELRKEVESLLSAAHKPSDYLPDAVRKVARRMKNE